MTLPPHVAVAKKPAAHGPRTKLAKRKRRRQDVWQSARDAGLRPGTEAWDHFVRAKGIDPAMRPPR